MGLKVFGEETPVSLAEQLWGNAPRALPLSVSTDKDWLMDGTSPLISGAGCHLLGTEHQSLTQKLSETWAASLSHRLPVNLQGLFPGGSARKQECLGKEEVAERF